MYYFVILNGYVYVVDAAPKKRKSAPAKSAKPSRGQKGRKRARREEVASHL